MGQPAVSVLAGWTDTELPVGLQVVGGHLADETVLAAALEKVANWHDRWPAIVDAASDEPPGSATTAMRNNELPGLFEDLPSGEQG
jgi:aspartyl-tRNA(Asn)/glutamyl-tRNA(Gln) amidotransferase subunit A